MPLIELVGVRPHLRHRPEKGCVTRTSGGPPLRVEYSLTQLARSLRAADWEFTYFRGGQLVHVLNRNVLANAQHAYALYWSTPAGEWDASYHYFLVFAATFSPASAGPGS